MKKVHVMYSVRMDLKLQTYLIQHVFSSKYFLHENKCQDQRQSS